MAAHGENLMATDSRPGPYLGRRHTLPLSGGVRESEHSVRESEHR